MREALHAEPGIRSTPVTICFRILRQKNNVNEYGLLESYTAQEGVDMRFNPAKSSYSLFEQGRSGLLMPPSAVRGHMNKVAIAVTQEAQKRVSRFTVAIGTLGPSQNSTDIDKISPGSGVIVELHNDMHAILTAAHVLRRGKNTPDRVEISLIVPPRKRNVDQNAHFINLQSRPCTIDGFYNETKEGADIAMIPLSGREWEILDARGMVAYNLNRERWSDKDRAAISEMDSWLLSVIHGARFMESKVIHDRVEHELGTIVMMTTDTRIDVVRKRGGYDYMELPANTRKLTLPTHWEMELPGTVVEEISELQEQGVTQRVWSGTSGAGVWNLAIGMDQNGMPTGDTWGELAGICFFANPDHESIIAHGSESIRAIADLHMKDEVFRQYAKSGGTM